jgi:hypothetical protein
MTNIYLDLQREGDKRLIVDGDYDLFLELLRDWGVPPGRIDCSEPYRWEVTGDPPNNLNLTRGSSPLEVISLPPKPDPAYETVSRLFSRSADFVSFEMTKEDYIQRRDEVYEWISPLGLPVRARNQILRGILPNVALPPLDELCRWFIQYPQYLLNLRNVGVATRDEIVAVAQAYLARKEKAEA